MDVSDKPLLGTILLHLLFQGFTLGAELLSLLLVE